MASNQQSQAVEVTRLTQQYSDLELASRMQLEEIMAITLELAKDSTHGEAHSQSGGFGSGKYYDHEVPHQLAPLDQHPPRSSSFDGVSPWVPPFDEDRPWVRKFDDVHPRAPPLDEDRPRVWNFDDVRAQLAPLDQGPPRLSRFEDLSPRVLSFDEDCHWVLNSDDVRPRVPPLEEDRPGVSNFDDVRARLPPLDENHSWMTKVNEDLPRWSRFDDVHHPQAPFDDDRSGVSNFDDVRPRLPLFDEDRPWVTNVDEDRPRWPRFDNVHPRLPSFDENRSRLSDFDDVRPMLPPFDEDRPRWSRFDDVHRRPAPFDEYRPKFDDVDNARLRRDSRPDRLYQEYDDVRPRVPPCDEDRPWMPKFDDVDTAQWTQHSRPDTLYEEDEFDDKVDHYRFSEIDIICEQDERLAGWLNTLPESEWEDMGVHLDDPFPFPSIVPADEAAEAAERYTMKGKGQKFDEDTWAKQSSPYEDENEHIPFGTCNICMVTEITSDNSHMVNDKCNHRFCTDCLGQHGQTMVNSGKSEVSCPQYKCTESLSSQLCQLLLSPDALDQMTQRQVENMISDSERVYCPYTDCSALQLRPDLPAPDEPFNPQGTAVGEVECLSCHRLFCLECQVPWHPNLTCEEYRSLQEGERSDLVLITGLVKDNKWQRCVCGYVVERNEGCNHIKCRCGKEFCYICGGNWSYDHLCNTENP